MNLGEGEGIRRYPMIRPFYPGLDPLYTKYMVLNIVSEAVLSV